jgi:hypothetical protein
MHADIRRPQHARAAGGQIALAYARGHPAATAFR